MENEGTHLPDENMMKLKELLDLIHEAIRHVRSELELDNGESDLAKAMDIENRINKCRDRLLEYHYGQLENKTYSNQVGFVFLDYVNRLEKIGDHLFNVNEAIAGVKVKAAYEKVVEANE
jgi:phosphate:Na+ symporter